MTTNPTTLDIPAATSITVTQKMCFKYGDLPYFARAIVGLYVRIKISSTKFIWTKVIKAENRLNKPVTHLDEATGKEEPGSPGGVYDWKPPQSPGGVVIHAKRFALFLKVDQLGGEHQWVPLTSISNSPPQLTEIEEYRHLPLQSSAPANGDESLPTSTPVELPTPEEVEKLSKKMQVEVVKRTLTSGDAREVLELNMKLKPLHTAGCTVSLNTVGLNNDLVRRTSLHGAAATCLVKGEEAGSLAEDEQLLVDASKLLAETTRTSTGSMSQTPLLGLQGTQSYVGDATASFEGANESSSQVPQSPGAQTFGRGLSSFEDSVRQSNHQMQSQVADRTAEQEMLVTITERNKQDNRQWILTGDHYEKTAHRKYNLDESDALWTINDAKRKELCDRYDDRKEERGEFAKNKKDGGDGGNKAAAMAKSLDDPDTLLEHCLSVRQNKKEKGAASIPADILTMDLKLTSPTAGSGSLDSPIMRSPSGSFNKVGGAGAIRSASRPVALLAKQRSSSQILGTSAVDSSRGKRARSAGETN